MVFYIHIFIALNCLHFWFYGRTDGGTRGLLQPKNKSIVLLWRTALFPPLDLWDSIRIKSGLSSPFGFDSGEKFLLIKKKALERTWNVGKLRQSRWIVPLVPVDFSPMDWRRISCCTQSGIPQRTEVSVGFSGGLQLVPERPKERGAEGSQSETSGHLVRRPYGQSSQ